MLTELRIENFAIIQQLELRPGKGLITFTGETGAGKSILLDALVCVVGGKTDPTMIRAGADRAMVEATFTIPDASRQVVTDLLKAEDLLDDENTVTLGRELRKEGRSVARVNGRSVAVSLLKDLGAYLVDIHGQSEHLSLLNVRQHVRLLDRFAADTGLLDAWHKAHRELLDVRRQLAAVRQTETDAARRTDFLTFQVQEIESAHLQTDEEEELRRERDRLANAESLADLAQQTLSLLDEGSGEVPAISDLLGQVVDALSSLSRIDRSLEPMQQQAEGVMDNIDDIVRTLRLYQEQIEFNPRRLEQVEDRLDLINNLKRKYGGSIEAVLTFEREARAQLDAITHAGERIAELEESENALLAQLAGHGMRLSEARKQAAGELARGVETELTDLSMSGARFHVDMQYRPDEHGITLPDGSRIGFDEWGLDQVEFLIAPNPGEGLKPLVKIASGGETSRLMLALKNVLARADEVPTLVFDEIDQGIGGRVGGVIGEKLWQLGRSHQVLCVTHLPQLAAFGDQHFRVQKHVQDGRTTTRVESLSGAVRLDELAQMLGNLTDANRSAAQETLNWARSRAESLANRS